MNPDAFASPPGRVEMGSKGYFYYVPPRIPGRLDYSDSTILELSHASHRLGELNSWSSMLPNPHLLIRPYIQREALLSSKIEGTQATLSEVLMGEAGQVSPARSADIEEVQNYVRALEYGRKALKSGPPSLESIQGMHAILMRGVRGHDKDPGEFRRAQNWIGDANCRLEDATYVPPEPEAMKRCLRELETDLTKWGSMPELARIALVHYQFEAIHPFRDGNGRIGRLLITLLLLQQRLLDEPLLYLSAFFEKQRDQYYARLLAISQKGDYSNWLTFFCQGVSLQAEDANQRCRSLLALHGKFRRTLHEAKATPGTLQLLDHLFANPYTSIPLAAQVLKTTFPTAQRAVEKYLVANGILSEVTGQARNRIFVAREVMNALEKDLNKKPARQAPLPLG